MYAFIKDSRTFKTKCAALVLAYSVSRSVYDTVSKVTIAAPTVSPSEGDIVYLDEGFMGLITTISPDGDEVELSLVQIVSLFSRSMYYIEEPYIYLEDYIAKLIKENYTRCRDEFYALPWLEVTVGTHSNVNLTPTLEEGTFSVKSYAAAARRIHNIFLEWDITRDTLYVNIVRREKAVKNVDFSNPDYMLLTEDYSSKTVSKVTAYCEEDGAYEDFILTKSGDIVSSASIEDRIAGEWVTLKIRNAEDKENEVKGLFLKNEYSHKITFRTDRSRGFELYDRLLIALNGKVFSSYVSGVTVTDNSNLAEISCGELQMEYPYHGTAQ